MRVLSIFALCLLLTSCEKDECSKSLFSPVGFASCDVATCQEQKEVEIEGQTVCACLTGYIGQELSEGETVDISKKKADAIEAAKLIENDSLRLQKLAIYTAFDFYVDCSRF